MHQEWSQFKNWYKLENSLLSSPLCMQSDIQTKHRMEQNFNNQTNNKTIRRWTIIKAIMTMKH